MNISAVILAGGKSSRMGRDKAFLEINGQTFLARQLQLARELNAREIFISGRPGTNYHPPEYPVLVDAFPNSGPLAGIEAALRHMTTPRLLVLAVDLPNIPANFLNELLMKSSEHSGIIPYVNGQLEPLAAIYPRKAQPLATERCEAQQLSVRDFAIACQHSGLAMQENLSSASAVYFRNYNTPADLI